MRLTDFLTFLVAVLVIWGLGTLHAQRGRRLRSGFPWLKLHPLSFIIGVDNRLSLSRLQAFLWTMAIFGTYAAAWRAHGAIQPATPDAIQQVDALAKQTSERAIQGHATAIQLGITAQSLNELARAATLDSAVLFPAPGDTTKRPASLDSLNRVLALRRKDATDAQASLSAGNRAARIDSAKASALDADAARYKWIVIPAGLLALAGISIGSGVFASVIAASNSTGGHPSVTAAGVARYTELPATYQLATASLGADAVGVVLQGSNLGDEGRVRFGSDFAEVLYWDIGGRTAVVVLPASLMQKGSWGGKLIVDTPNGKIAYRAQLSLSQLRRVTLAIDLGLPIDALEWSDLFRDDSSPTNLSLMKFQMFGWTLISLILYLWNAFTALRAQHVLASLPAIDGSLVILMGVSQAAYLTNKGVQNVQSPPAPQQASTTASVPGAVIGAVPQKPIDRAGGERGGLIPPAA